MQPKLGNIRGYPSSHIPRTNIRAYFRAELRLDCLDIAWCAVFRDQAFRCFYVSFSPADPDATLEKQTSGTQAG